MTKALRGRVNDPVFRHTGDKGSYVAKLLGYNVRIDKHANAYWEVSITDPGEEGVIASGSNRVEAMKEAYYTLMFRESQRLDWILANQPYRQYPDTHPRRKAKLPESEPKQGEESVEATEPVPAKDIRVRDGKMIQKDDGRVVTHAKLKAIRDKYFIKQNRTLGGHFWFEKDKEGVVKDFGGPFESDDLAFKDILEREEIIR